jgi:hypothetical protein
MDAVIYGLALEAAVARLAVAVMDILLLVGLQVLEEVVQTGNHLALYMLVAVAVVVVITTHPEAVALVAVALVAVEAVRQTEAVVVADQLLPAPVTAQAALE